MVGIKSDVGKVRNLNEDCAGYVEEESYKLYIVADGMGGHNAGEVASSMAVSSIKEYVRENFEKEYTDVLKNSIIYANNKIFEKATSGEELKGMGTTIVAALVTSDLIVIANVGDSCCYKLNSNIQKITKDHSLVQELIDSGTITEEEGKTHPKRNVITRALGTNNTVKIDIFNIYKDISEKFLLCTDGLTNEISKEEILLIVNENKDLDSACNELILLAKDRGGRDNITVLLFGGEV